MVAGRSCAAIAARPIGSCPPSKPARFPVSRGRMPELGADAGSEDWGLCDHAPRCLYQHAVSDSWIGPDDDPPPFGQGLLARWLAGYKSEERRVGKGWGRPWRSRGWAYH